MPPIAAEPATGPLGQAIGRVDPQPLTVHDIEGLDQPPLRVALSTGDSGVSAPVGTRRR